MMKNDLKEIKRFKIKLNDDTNLKDLLQEVYDRCVQQENLVMDHMSKLENSLNLSEEILDSKVKWSGAINNLLKTRQEAITKKLEVAKVLQAVIVQNSDDGNKNKGNEDDNKFDVSKLKKFISAANEDNNTDKVNEYTVNKK
jgi:hypothetical protein